MQSRFRLVGNLSANPLPSLWRAASPARKPAAVALAYLYWHISPDDASSLEARARPEALSLDGRAHLIPRDVHGPKRLNWRACEDGGGDYVARPNGFGRCSKGHMHCGRCGSVARRFRKGYVCGNC